MSYVFFLSFFFFLFFFNLRLEVQRPWGGEWQRHSNSISIYFSAPRQISFVITPLVINFTGNIYTWLVSLSGTIFSLPSFLSWWVIAVKAVLNLQRLRKSYLFYVGSQSRTVFIPWSWPAITLYWTSTATNHPHCRSLWALGIPMCKIHGPKYQCAYNMEFWK